MAIYTFVVMKSINETHYTLTFKCIFRQNWLENQGILFFCGLIYIFKKNIKSMCHSCGKTHVGTFVIMCVGHFYCTLRNKMDMYNTTNIY